MCKITVVDFDISEIELKRILLLNELAGNDDGFGFYNVDTKLLWKTQESFSQIMFEKPFSDVKGIYHVRKASISSSSTYVRSGDTETFIKKERRLNDSHPFKEDNLVVVHNGTLTFRTTHKDAGKYESSCIKQDYIDSLKYTKLLASVVNKEVLNLQHIKTATNFFSGPFVLVHYDELGKKLWISRGKDKTLFKLLLFNKDKEIVGIIFNTSLEELYQYATMLMFYSDDVVDFDISLLKENTTYSYEFGSFNLIEEGSVEQDSTYISTVITAVTSSYYNKQPFATVLTQPFEHIIKLCGELNFTIKHLLNIYKIVFDKDLTTASLAELKNLSDILSRLYFENSKSKNMLWKKILEQTSLPSAYHNLQYPYMLNSPKTLKNFLREVKK